ncbi:MAG: phenylalanine--tRNA ligase subunit alpha [Sandaracinaceae bacterium]|nr:phenylalanine--tRNA ligase subunit alpha [Sandaracinaceae bacterium]
MSSPTDAAKDLEQGLLRLEQDRASDLERAGDEHALREARARLVGPSGELTLLMKRMPELPKDSRRAFGQRINAVKQAIEAEFEAKLAALAQAARRAELEGSRLDPTLPGRALRRGRAHPIQRTIHELLDVFVSLGFDVEDAPEVDLAANNFDKLGFPPDHPATDMQDSFFVQRPGGERDRDVVLRTHTTTIQVHQMSSRTPPMAVVCPGAVYRRDDDATHSPMFAQIDGFAVDEGLTFAHLKGVLTTFVRRLFGDDVPVRFRPSYFPFVEPGGELDMGCVFCRPWQGNAERTAACRVCKGTGWMEILGCGMIHPVVFEHLGVDSTRYTGFAFGMGIDRITMLRHGVGNIRLLYENDARFLGQL